ncbi:MAG: hypothetical protein QF449_14240 [Alphaproteobacteria bacterium]|nr:hypothetical protein [Alphaproteobacteria bacterium]MDP6587894.1 hypothetical protein [Alphaproteobacteria bacterium]MDP6819184.1 hypothetical protein [Alphaproteobacteria bacterium]
MDITNFDISFNRRGAHGGLGGLGLGDILAALRLWARAARSGHAQRRPPAGRAAIGDHLMRDIGITRLGMRETAHTGLNEAGAD